MSFIRSRSLACKDSQPKASARASQLIRRFILASAVSALVGCAAKNGISGNEETVDMRKARAELLQREVQPFTLRKPERWELSNGLIVFYLQDNELPIVRGKLYLPGGKLWDPKPQAGLFNALGDQMREGSVTGMSPEALDKKLDALAASIETDYGLEWGSVSFSCLVEDTDEVLALTEKVIRTPAFDEGRFRLWKELAGQSIRRRRDDPGTMAGLASGTLIYGETSPYASVSTEESIRSLSTSVLREAHKQWVRPNGSRLALVSPYSKEEAMALVQKYFGAWVKKTEPLPPLPAVDMEAAKPGIYVLERDFEQVTVSMGHIGPPRGTPDLYEMGVYNRILGTGGFGSLLFSEIRSKLGLAYDVGGGLAPGIGRGTFSAFLATRSNEGVRATDRVIDVIQRTLRDLPADENFQLAKSSVERSFVFRFDSSLAVVNRSAQLEIFGYPPDFDETYLERLIKVTPEMVRDVGQKWVDPEKLVIIIVGRVRAEDVKEKLGSPSRPVYRLTFDTMPHVGEVLR